MNSEKWAVQIFSQDGKQINPPGNTNHGVLFSKIRFCLYPLSIIASHGLEGVIFLVSCHSDFCVNKS